MRVIQHWVFIIWKTPGKYWLKENILECPVFIKDSNLSRWERVITGKSEWVHEVPTLLETIEKVQPKWLANLYGLI